MNEYKVFSAVSGIRKALYNVSCCFCLLLLLLLLRKTIAFLVTKSCKNVKNLTNIVLAHLDRFTWFIQYDMFLVHSVYDLLVVQICD